MQPSLEITKIGKRGAFVIPADLRQQYGLHEGSLVITEATIDGILLKPAVAMAVELYTPERQAEFLLSNTVDTDDYQAACALVREMGLDPAAIDHIKPDNADAPSVS